MTLAEAASQGIARVRLKIWASPVAYLKQDVFPDGSRGPWGHLYDRPTQEVIGAPTPQDVLIIGDAIAEYLAYDGPVDPDDGPDA